MKTINEIIKTKGSIPQLVPITSVKVELQWWDREGFSDDAVERYKQLYQDGSHNPILLQKGTKRLIDGFHRTRAAKEAGRDKIHAIELDVEDSEIPLIQILANLNHGVPLSHTERDKAIIRTYVLGHKTQQEIAETTRLSRGRVAQILEKTRRKLEGDDISNVSTNITNIASGAEKEALIAGYEDADRRTKVSAFKKLKIIEDLMAGFDQKETANKFDISQPRVSQIYNEFRDEVANYYRYNDRNGETNAGHSKKDTAEHFGLQESVVDKLLSEVEPEPLNFKLPITTWWPAFSLAGGQTNYPGVTPLELTKSVLALFTKPSDHIIDLMAGSGSVGRACQDMVGRTYELFDATPVDDRITKHNLVGKHNQPALPSIKKSPSLVFLDPPYSTVAEAKYKTEHDLARLDTKDFRVFILRMLRLIKQTWHPCRIVLLIASINKEATSAGYTKGALVDNPSYFGVCLSGRGFRPLAHIVNEVGNSSSHTPLWKYRAEKGKWLLEGHIHILVAETVE